jgi:hypothetical protein
MAPYISNLKPLELEIEPNQSVGPIQFNAKRSENRKHIASSPYTYAQSESELPNDTYEDLGLFVIYDKYNTCGAVECKSPSKVIFENVSLLTKPYDELRDWLQTLDPNVVESEKDLISFDLGIELFAPDKDKNPKTPCESVTIFRKNFFYRKIGIADPEIFSTFLIQPGFVEGIEKDQKLFNNITEAYEYIFRNNKEYLVLLWNAIPVLLDYKVDIPCMIEGIINMLHMLVFEQENETTINFETPQIKSTWSLQRKGERLRVIGNWQKAPGDYEEALNQHRIVDMNAEEFCYEWRLIVVQLVDAFTDSGVLIDNPDHNKLLAKLMSLPAMIKNNGRFYRDETRILK